MKESVVFCCPCLTFHQAVSTCILPTCSKKQPIKLSHACFELCYRQVVPQPGCLRLSVRKNSNILNEGLQHGSQLKTQLQAVSLDLSQVKAAEANEKSLVAHCRQSISVVSIALPVLVAKHKP